MNKVALTAINMWTSFGTILQKVQYFNAERPFFLKIITALGAEIQKVQVVVEKDRC